MKKVILLTVSALFCEAVAAQSVSHAICQSYAGIMESTIVPWRQSGQVPIGAAEDVWNSESDARTRVFLKRVTREIYKNPRSGSRYLQSGGFLTDCVKTHRGF